MNKLKTHLKKFTVKELKKEVMKVKKQFQVSKLRRADVERVILLYHRDFLHLLKDKKKEPSVKDKEKKPYDMSMKPNKQQLNMLMKPNKQQNDMSMKPNNQQKDMSMKQYINELLDKLDEKAAGKKYPEFIDERYSGVTIQKSKSHYVIRDTNDFSNVLLKATADRKQVEDLLYHMLT